MNAFSVSLQAALAQASANRLNQPFKIIAELTPSQSWFCRKRTRTFSSWATGRRFQQANKKLEVDGVYLRPGRRSSSAVVKASLRDETPKEEGSLSMLAAFLPRPTPKNLQIAGAAALTTALSITNRVLYKMALVPLHDYPFFLAQVTTFGYVLVYFSVLLIRKQAGLVTDEMLAVPKKRFAAMGALEAVGLAMGMVAATVLPGALIPVLTQVFLFWQLILSSLFLRKSYALGQLLGVALVVAGVVVVVASGGGAGSALQQVGLVWPLAFALSTAFPAASSILKEGVFRDAKEQLKGRPLDIFVVNSFGSGFQALFVLALLPLLSSQRGIPLAELPAYLRNGAACFVNAGSGVTGCEGAPLLPFLYVASNLAFNVSALNLLRMSSAIVASLCMTLSVPLTIAVFTLRLPYLGTPGPLPPGFWPGSMVLLAGLLLYNTSGQQQKPAVKER